MNGQVQHEKMFLVLTILVCIATVTNLLLTQRMRNLELSVGLLKAQLGQTVLPQAFTDQNFAGAIPVISSMSPTSGPAGTLVTITGTGFDATDNQITFGNVRFLADSTDKKIVTFYVPDGIRSLTKHMIFLENSYGKSSSVEFTVKL